MSRQRNITIKVDSDLYKQINEQLKAKGTTIEVFIRLQLIAGLKVSAQCLGLKDKMPFGKYAGASVEDIVRGDTKYAAWLVSQDGSKKFHGDVINLITELNQ